MQTAPRVKSIRNRFLSIQVISISLTVALLIVFCFFLLADFHSELQREKLEALARSQAIEAGQVIEKLKDDLRRINLFDFHLTARAEPLLLEFKRYSTSFPKITLLQRDGKEAFKYVVGPQVPGQGSQLLSQPF